MKKSKILSILAGAALFLAVALPILFLEAVVGGFIMKQFGFQYDSMKAVFLFFLIAAIVDAPFEILAEAFPKAMESLGWVRRSGRLFLWFVLDMVFDMAAFAMTDHFMDSIRADVVGIVLVSALSSGISILLGRKEEGASGEN